MPFQSFLDCYNAIILNRLRLGDTTTISALSDVKVAKRVFVLPFKDSVEGLTGDLLDVFVMPYFVGKFRPLKLNDIFVARGAMREVEFKVVAMESSEEDKSSSSLIVQWF